MRICIYGAGAIGGFLGARLALAGVDVSLILRGPHLAATKANGLTLLDAHGTRTVRVTATEDPAELGPQDYVIITLKAHSAAQVAERMVPLLGPGTAVVTAVNGLPWWYFHGLDGPFGGHRLQTVDPTGAQWDVIGPERAIGCVVYPAAEVIEPGVVKHIENDRFTLGEPNGEKSERVMALAKTMQDAGLKVPVRPRIRDEIWIKLWGQPDLQPDQRADRGDARRDLRHARHPRTGPRHDGRGPTGGRGARHPLPDRHRKADRRGGLGRRAQDLRCSRTWNAAARWRSTRWSDRWPRLPVWSAWRRRPSTQFWRWCECAAGSAGAIRPDRP